MTTAQAQTFGWIIAQPVVALVMFGAVLLLGLALLREMTR